MRARGFIQGCFTLMTIWDDLEALWRERHQAARLEEFARALDAAEPRALDQQYERLWRLARLAHFRAMQAETDGENKAAREHFKAGVKWGAEAAAARLHGVEAPFWWGVNRLEAARYAGAVARWRALKPAEALIGRAEATDERYHFAGPLRVHGRITHRKPLLLGGSIDMALLFYRRALQIAPDNSTTLFYYAEALLDDRQRRAARSVLRQIADAPGAPDWLWEQERDRRRALDLLEATRQE
jgi:hypothetical protein